MSLLLRLIYCCIHILLLVLLPIFLLVLLPFRILFFHFLVLGLVIPLMMGFDVLTIMNNSFAIFFTVFYKWILFRLLLSMDLLLQSLHQIFFLLFSSNGVVPKYAFEYPLAVEPMSPLLCLLLLSFFFFLHIYMFVSNIFIPSVPNIS